jgi:predicted nuclease with TOPRIM domain
MEHLQVLVTEINDALKQLDFFKKAFINNLQDPLNKLLDYIKKLEQRVKELEDKLKEYEEGR